ncbi:MAG: hypothetical protein N2449_01310 [Bacteroidales bacterium]|nr:hypothetical protein [Bacteroidales bacterium]
MKQYLTIFFFNLMMLKSSFVFGQSTFSLEAHTIGMHFFGNPNLRYYENNLDSLGFFCVEPGLMVSYEFYIKDNWLSMQLSQSIFADAAGLTAGFTKWSLRYMFFHKFRNQLYIDVAPAITYRRAWDVLGVHYVPETRYQRNGKIEFRPAIIAKIEYDIFIGNNNDINMSVMYGNAYKTISFLIGYRHWISTKVRFTKDCNCNHFKKKNIFRRIFR